MDRNTESLRTSIQSPEPDTGMDQLLGGLADAGQKIIAMDQQAKIADSISKARLDLTQQSQDYRLKNADNPFKNFDELKQQNKDTLTGYGENISPFFQRKWMDEARNLQTQNEAQNEIWAYKQTKENTVKSINSSMQTSFQQANIDGQNYATGQGNELDAILNFAPSRAHLEEFGSQNIGSNQTDAMLKNYNKDYVKSFVAGVAETNPQKAAALLDDPMVKQHFTTQDRGEFIDIINKTQKQQELQKSLQITQNTQQVTDLVNDPSQSFFNKRLQLDKMELSGAIAPKTASEARRVITSQKDVDSVTDSETMGPIIQKIYDLNSIQGMNNSDYLKGVQNIHDLILEKQADGSLNSIDVKKMNDEMSTLTSKRVSDATKSVGYDLSDATDKFQTLPPEYRGEATRQLFYATAGKSDGLTDDQYKKLTEDASQKVLDNINAQRRQSTLNSLQKNSAITQDDWDFVKTKGYTPDDVQETAKKNGVTPYEVIVRLRAKYDKGPQ